MIEFENLVFLFSYSTYNRDICRLDLDEASYIYSLIKRLDSPICVEIGRYLGGSTILISSAGGYVISVDDYSSKTFSNYKYNPINDIKKLLKDMKLASQVELIIGDSRNYPNKDIKCDVLFIDGDHTYEGVKADYKHWIDTLQDGGHLLFHDSCKARENATMREDVAKFMLEVPYKVYNKVGSITHFIKD